MASVKLQLFPSKKQPICLTSIRGLVKQKKENAAIETETEFFLISSANGKVARCNFANFQFVSQQPVRATLL